MLKVLVNVAFNDKYTGKLYEAGKELEITKERATEIQNVDKGLITILCEIKEELKEESKGNPEDDKKGKDK